MHVQHVFQSRTCKRSAKMKTCTATQRSTAVDEARPFTQRGERGSIIGFSTDFERNDRQKQSKRNVMLGVRAVTPFLVSSSILPPSRVGSRMQCCRQDTLEYSVNDQGCADHELVPYWSPRYGDVQYREPATDKSAVSKS